MRKAKYFLHVSSIVIFIVLLFTGYKDNNSTYRYAAIVGLSLTINNLFKDIKKKVSV